MRSARKPAGSAPSIPPMAKIEIATVISKLLKGTSITPLSEELFPLNDALMTWEHRFNVNWDYIA